MAQKQKGGPLEALGSHVVGARGAIALLLLALACAAGALLFGHEGGLELKRGAPESEALAGDATADEQQDAPGPSRGVVVHVDGSVSHPGVYEIEGAAPRARDAVEAAGGLSEGADTSGINLAAPLKDGEKIHIPSAEDTQVQDQASAVAAAVAPGLVNINSASAEELCTLPGVGQSTAAAIIRDRESNGSFSSVEDLMRVSGIGEKKFERLKDNVVV
ncbi:ComEA family DNA-binding protein [Olsenella urininfantis]|uniref:ComEA family DNA-binding protein n=1 Tax=Olsenella urininfantis TaxID=1871033 RepID=UPI0013563606|nr:ComEA family DNA-binding protein [Olsenella urininfantis]